MIKYRKGNENLPVRHEDMDCKTLYAQNYFIFEKLWFVVLFDNKEEESERYNQALEIERISKGKWFSTTMCFVLNNVAPEFIFIPWFVDINYPWTNIKLPWKLWNGGIIRFRDKHSYNYLNEQGLLYGARLNPIFLYYNF